MHLIGMLYGYFNIFRSFESVDVAAPFIYVVKWKCEDVSRLADQFFFSIYSKFECFLLWTDYLQLSLIYSAVYTVDPKCFTAQ